MAAGLLWGTTGTAQAYAPETAQPHAIGALRLLVAGAALIPYAYARRAIPDSRRWPLPLTAIAAVSIAAYQPLFFRAVATTGVAVGTVVAIGSSPIIAGFVEWMARGVRPDLRWVSATLLAVAGTVLLFIGDSRGVVTPVGVLLALGAGSAYAMYVVASKGLLDAHKPDAVIAVVFGLSALMSLPILFFVDVEWVFSAHGAATVLYLGLVATALAYILFVRGLKTLSAGSAVTLSLAEPLTAATLGVVLLGEQLSPTAILGAALILVGLAIIGIRRSTSQDLR